MNVKNHFYTHLSKINKNGHCRFIPNLGLHKNKNNVRCKNKPT